MINIPIIIIILLKFRVCKYKFTTMSQEFFNFFNLKRKKIGRCPRQRKP